ncbi:hypothetical protein JCM8547_004871 [Rhodosporidiobolus lusitaniae]
MASATPQPGTGFKLKVKLGGQPAVSAAPAPAAQSVYQPAYPQHPSPAPQAAPGAVFGGEATRYGVTGQYGRAYGAQDEDEEETVSLSKYKKLKKRYLEAVESRDDSSLALFRAQKLIHRLREDKSALLDRVVQLEIAAGLTTYDVSLTRDATLRSERELAFPLLHPPALPSLADRPQKAPVIRTDADLSNPDYNKPLGAAPLPETFPPRQRSHHLRTAIAAQKLRDDHSAQLAAHGLVKPAFPAVSVLGLEGSTIAFNVERALAGEPFQSSSAADAAPARGSKRRRESSTGAGGSGRGKSRAASASVAPSPYPAALLPPASPAPAQPVTNLPNPFAAIGAAVPVGTSMSRNNAEALAASAAPPLPPAPLPSMPIDVPLPAAPSPSIAPTVTATPAPAASATPMAVDQTPYAEDDDGSFSDNYVEAEEDDGGAYRPTATKRGRKSAGGGGAGGGDGTGGYKPKKVKAHGVVSETHKIPPVARNADGTPTLPVQVGMVTVQKLGSVVNRENWFTERYIFPVGYESTRKYSSMIDPNSTVEYTCRVVQSDHGDPRFELHPSDQPGVVITGGTPTYPWTQVLRAAMKIRNRQHSGGVSGPDYFAFSSNTVKAMIQELPGAKKVDGYVWQNFVEDPSAIPRGSAAAAEAKRAAQGGSGSRRRSGRGQSEAASPEADYSNDYAVDSPAAAGANESIYGREYSPPAGSPLAYDVNLTDSGPGSLQYLLAAANNPPDLSSSSDPYAIPPSVPVDPYAIPPSAGGGAAYDPFLAVAEAAVAANAAAAYDPYAIPPANGAGGDDAIDPSFGDYGQAANAFAYGLPGSE